MKFNMSFWISQQSNQLISPYFLFQKFIIDNECIIFKKIIVQMYS
jgi:hypothetical protein